MNDRALVQRANEPATNSVSTGSRNRALHEHSTWRAFIRFCGELQHGEIEHLRIQDGLPVLAEVTRKKVKFT